MINLFSSFLKTGARDDANFLAFLSLLKNISNFLKILINYYSSYLYNYNYNYNSDNDNNNDNMLILIFVLYLGYWRGEWNYCWGLDWGFGGVCWFGGGLKGVGNFLVRNRIYWMIDQDLDLIVWGVCV